ncbi:hypothetical protein Hypma_012251 [Hypsizygus marmoreus]|uniref:Uncharacterized protein n=1 Tax=Hypsizygus marmoreus TaxID=39966 RepID=A0A369JMK1_HYPMA|nr:hypothetical protein Hypma_012251 [Hypsizygus marmoreus]
MKEAIPARVEHRLVLEDFELAIPAATLMGWQSQVEAWEKDAKAKNPYKTEVKSECLPQDGANCPVLKVELFIAVSEHAVRLELAKEVEQSEIGRDSDFLDEVHPSIMISTGLQIEDEQYVLSISCFVQFFPDSFIRRRLASDLSSLGQHATNKQLATMAERSNKLRRKIASWIDVQTLYMPAVALERAKRGASANPDGVAPTKVQNVSLWLPSALLDVAPVDASLRLYEWKLREGQAYDALEELRHNLRLRSHLLKDKDRFARGVKHNTRSNAAIKKLNVKINRAAVKYRVARRALLSLSPGLKMSDWQHTLRDLAQDDVRALSEGLHGDTEGTRRPSWIWTTPGVVPKEGEDTALSDGEISFRSALGAILTE